MVASRASRTRSAIVLATMLPVLGCSADRAPSAPAGTAVSLEDSAGVGIVTLGSRQALTELPEWVLADTPELRVGLVSGEAPYQFHQVRDARRRSDGSIVVLNGGTQELRVFDSDGGFLFSAGGRGEGPGEFRQILALGVLDGDSIAVWERLTQRASVITPDGRFERSWDTRLCSDQIVMVSLGSDACLLVDGVFADGTMLVPSLPPYTGMPPVAGLVVGEQVAIGRMGPDHMERIDSLRQGDTFFAYVTGLGPVGYRALFGGHPVWASGRRLLAYGRTDRGEIRIRSSEGDLHQVIRFAFPPDPVTDDDIGRYRAHDWGMEVDHAAEWLDESTVSPTKPYHGAVRFDRSDRLWIEDLPVYRIAPPDAGSTWTVFSTDGEPMKRVTLPPTGQLALYELGEDWVLGKEVDELGVEYVALYRLVPAAGGPGSAWTAVGDIQSRVYSGLELEGSLAEEHLSLGWTAGDGVPRSDVLHRVRSASRLPSGLVAVASTDEGVRMYSHDGLPVATLGRGGRVLESLLPKGS